MQNRVARRLPAWLAVPVMATGIVTATPAMSAFACGAETTAYRVDQSTVVAAPAAAARAGSTVPAVQVSGPGSLVLPAGTATPFAITVTNSGATFAGRIWFEVSGGDDLGKPGITMEMSPAGGGWKTLPDEGAMGRRYFTADDLTFQTGESSFGFRVTVAAARERLGFRAELQGPTGQTASTGFSARVTEAEPAKPRVRTTFPAKLERGGPWSEFGVTVGNPSTTTYNKLKVHLNLTALAQAPRKGRGYLAARDVRLEQRVGGTWQRVALHDGDCDPGVSATLSGPSDLRPGASRNLKLRIRLADSTPKALRAGTYSLPVTVQEIDDAGAIAGRFVIEPRRAPAGGSQPPGASKPKPTTTSSPAGSNRPPVAEPTKLAHTGAVLLPLVGGAVLLLGGIGVLVYLRHRRPQG
jgi:hypothetical protein